MTPLVGTLNVFDTRLVNVGVVKPPIGVDDPAPSARTWLLPRNADHGLLLRFLALWAAWALFTVRPGAFFLICLLAIFSVCLLLIARAYVPPPIARTKAMAEITSAGDGSRRILLSI